MYQPALFAGTFKNEKLEVSDWTTGDNEGVDEDDGSDGEKQSED
jgi:hypothetical protein